MNDDALLSTFSRVFAPPLELQGRRLLLNGELIGLLNPSVVYGIVDDKVIANGPKGPRVLDKNKSSTTITRLLQSGSIISGTPFGIELLDSLLNDPTLSRTASYLLGLTQDADEIVAVFEKVRSLKIAIIGCGGVGSNSAVLLAGMGFCRFRLIDHDTIEASNLNRQVMWEKSDIGLPKTSVLARRLRARFDIKDIEEVPVALQRSTMANNFNGTDAIVFSADEPLGIGLSAQQEAERLGIPIIYGGYVNTKAVVEVGRPSVSQSNVCWKRPPGSVMPSYGPMNFEIAGRVAAALLRVACFGKPSRNTRTVWDTAA